MNDSDSMIRRLPLLRSVFTQLLAVLLVAGLAINGAVVFFFGAIRHKATDAYNTHLLRYANYLIDDMGEPPSVARARQIAGDTGMVIRFDSAEGGWTTGLLPPLDAYRVWYRSDRVEAGSRHGSHFVRTRRDDGRYTFFLPVDPAVEKRIKILGLGLLGHITLVLAGALWAVRRVLRPLRWLHEGVERVGMGDLNHRVSTRGARELHELARSFNAMAGQLKALIQTKDRLLVDASHELRSPITRMKVAVEFLPEGDAKSSIADDLAEMETMVTAILDAARTGNVRPAPKKEVTDLVPLLRQVVDILSGIPPGTVFQPSEPSICLALDPGQIRTAVRNLIENGQKYAADQPEPVVVSVQRDADRVVITVSDRGIGIPEAERERIFEPFYRVDKSRTRRTGGFGLGLSIVKNIVEDHDGQVRIAERTGGGTVVTIRLPAAGHGHGKKRNPGGG